MIDSNKANEILSTIQEGSSLVIVGSDGQATFIRTSNVGADLLSIQKDAGRFLAAISDRGIDPVILGVYDELEVPLETPEAPRGDERGYAEKALKDMSKMDKSQFTREQVLLLIPLKTLRLSWFRRPFGEPEQIQELIKSSPVTETLKSSPEGTVNRALVEAAISLRAATL